MRVRLIAHVPFAGVLAAAIWIRVIVVLGYPAPSWSGDSPSYLKDAMNLRPGETRPSGYPFLLRLIEPFHSFTVVVAVQHAIGVLTGVLVYVLVLRAGRAAWPPDRPGRWAWRVWPPALLAAALAVPVLMPVHQIALEHMLLSDSLFTFLLLVAVAAVLWRRRSTWWLGALAGMFAAFAALTRSAGLPLIAVILVAMLLRRAGWRACVSAAVMFALPVVGYMFWFQAHYGQFQMSKSSGIWLYGRTASFADCQIIKPRPELRIMCPRRTNPNISPAFAVMWTEDSPFRDIPGWVTGEEGNRLASEFAWAAIKKQPGDYARMVVHDTFMAFEWDRKPYPTPWTYLEYEFHKGESWSDKQALVAAGYGPNGEPRVVQPWAGKVLAYQHRVWMPGTFVGVLLLAGLAGAFLHVRCGGRWRPLRPFTHWGTGALLPWGTSLALLVIPAATADFDYRYVLPAVPFACVALALALLPPGPARLRPGRTGASADPRQDRRGHLAAS